MKSNKIVKFSGTKLERAVNMPPKLLPVTGGSYYRGGYLKIAVSEENRKKIIGEEVALDLRMEEIDKAKLILEAGEKITTNVFNELLKNEIPHILIKDQEADDEHPVHAVALDSFLIGQHLVTFAEYDVFCEATGKEKPRDEDWGRGQHPVINVNWYDAMDYCNWLSELWGYEQVYEREGKQVNINQKANGYRLPTEGEWEYAARGGEKTEGYLYSGSDNLDEVGWYSGNSNPKTQEVGQKKPNELGLYDMSGNVCEWNNDWKGSYKKTEQKNPQGPEMGSRRIVRGSYWGSSRRSCRPIFRNSSFPEHRLINVGFRLARSLGGSSS